MDVAGPNGTTDSKGVIMALQILNVTPSAQLLKYSKEADDNGSGEMNLGEFLSWIKFILRRARENIFEAEHGGRDTSTTIKESAAREAARHPLIARLASRRTGWVQSFFRRFDNIRNAF
jgi:hypothetical protein